MQIAIDTRTVDKDHLIHICVGRIACTIANHVIKFLRNRLRSSLVWRIKHWSDAHIFRARARLDVPTYQLSSVQRQLDDITPSLYMAPVAWRTIEMLSGFVRAATQATAQVAVLAQTLGGQKDGYLLAGLTLSSQTIQWLSRAGLISTRAQGQYLCLSCIWDFCSYAIYATAWAATTNDKHYLSLRGWKRAIEGVAHRQEVVAGNLGEYAVSGTR